ncbi:putative membrane associated protein [Gammaproteobacteria bacterium]
MRYFLQNLRILVTVAIITFLSSCAGVSAPTKIGVTESEWLGYSPDKQKALLANYEKFAAELNKSIKNNKNTVVDSVFLEIGIHDGKVMMPPFNSHYDYNPVKFVIFKDQCRSIILQQPTDEKIRTELEACFYGNILYLDPSHYDLTKKNGSISINFSPFWLPGFVYKGISSSGYVRLNNVTVEITQKEQTPRS